MTSGWLAKRNVRNRHKSLAKAIKVEMHKLDADFELFEAEINLHESNPLVPWGKLLLGVILLVIEILWIIQM